MSSVYLRGVGAVSPAGWGVEALWSAALARAPLPVKELDHPAGKNPLRMRVVPPASSRPAWMAHARLRRSSPVSQHALGAAMEALQMAGISVEKECAGLGIIVAVFSGCVQYSRRFYQEVLSDPSTASPLIFPETVFNAPASHLGAYLKCAAANYTLVGDAGAFLQAVAMGANWITMRKVKHCLVVATEEADWLAAEALRLFDKSCILAEGAGAVLLSGEPSAERSSQVRLAAVTDELLFSSISRQSAIRAVEAQLNSPESAWNVRSRISPPSESSAALRPEEVFGEGLMASSAWSVCLAAQALLLSLASTSSVTIAGLHQHAIGARFEVVAA